MEVSLLCLHMLKKLKEYILFKGGNINRHERRKMVALRRKSRRKPTTGAFGLPVFKEAMFSPEETNHQRRLRVQGTRRGK